MCEKHKHTQMHHRFRFFAASQGYTTFYLFAALWIIIISLLDNWLGRKKKLDTGNLYISNYKTFLVGVNESSNGCLSLYVSVPVMSPYMTPQWIINDGCLHYTLFQDG